MSKSYRIKSSILCFVSLLLLQACSLFDTAPTDGFPTPSQNELVAPSLVESSAYDFGQTPRV